MSIPITLLGLDVGRVRIGVAISDEAGRVISAVGTFARSKGTAEDKIKALISERGVGRIVVGLPLNQNGGRTEQCEDVENFCRRLERRIPVPIVFVDEHLTSEAAKERLVSKGRFDPKKDKELIDATAAIIILEDYFNLKR